MKRRLAIFVPAIAFMMAMLTTAGVVVAVGAGGTVVGGQENTARGESATVSGGWGNIADGRNASVVGGHLNNASGKHSVVAGGSSNRSPGGWSSVAGGIGNIADGNDTTIGGGRDNVVMDLGSTIVGGVANKIEPLNDSSSALFATIGGGAANTVSNNGATILGGGSNSASGVFSTIAGGRDNQAAGQFASIAGGHYNAAAGDYSFAAGRMAMVNAAHEGTFLFSDASSHDFTSEAANEFAVRATGGVRFVSGIDTDGSNVTGVQLPAGSGSWATLSDASAKANFTTIDSRQVLNSLSSIAIATWNYKGQHPSIRHIGPNAQDFSNAFGLGGESSSYISSVDADGVALAAIQGLYEIAQEKQAQIEGQSKQIEALQQHNQRLEARIAALEQAMGQVQ